MVTRPKDGRARVDDHVVLDDRVFISYQFTRRTMSPFSIPRLRAGTLG
jgi:hypothetical protein